VQATQVQFLLILSFFLNIISIMALEIIILTVKQCHKPWFDEECSKLVE
jgi:hypothetical protein